LCRFIHDDEIDFCNQKFESKQIYKCSGLSKMITSLRRDDNEQEESMEDLDTLLGDNGDENAEAPLRQDSNSSLQSKTELPHDNENSHEPEVTSTNSNDAKLMSDSKFFAVRTTGGQEHVVVNMAYNKINSKNLPVRSILLLESFKGYIIIEAPNSNIAYEALAGIRHVKGQIRGELPYKDIEGYLVKRPVVTELIIDDTVEVVAGPFKSMKAKITRVDYEKQEATVLLLDSPYQIPVTVDANYLKKVAQ
jgi:transcription termination/antitermination protein NusG